MSLQEELKTKKPVLGYEVTAKKMKKSDVSSVYLSSNCLHKNELRMLAKAGNISITELEQNSKQLGIICKKQFSVSVVSFK